MVSKSQNYFWHLGDKRSYRGLSRDHSDSRSYVDEYQTSSDTSPLYSYRRERYRRLVQDDHEYDDDDQSISISTLAKFFLFCVSMVLFFFLMYIPIYSRLNRPTANVDGWSIKSNRDTKLYIQPNNITTKLRPLHVCTNKKKLYLLIIVNSAVEHFESRAIIRESWGNYDNYVKMSELYKEVKDKYRSYNFTYNLFKFPQNVRFQKKYNKTLLRTRRGISYESLLPNLAKALKDKIENEETVELLDNDISDDNYERFGNEQTTINDNQQLEAGDGLKQEFDMNKVLDENDGDYDYGESNVMKIAPNGYQEVPNFSKILSLLRNKNPFAISKDVSEDNNYIDKVIDYDNFYINGEKAFKLIFLLGLPAHNSTTTQDKIDEESNTYGDILQENFIDSYNNLTLKSIMMLKWVVKNCKDSVRYIFKTDDDMFVNLPNLMDLLRNKTKTYEWQRQKGDKENLLLGYLIINAKPFLNRNSKWYSPSYMYSGKVYPKYLSGTGYLLTVPTAEALYAAALKVQYFHIEDIYITGFCAMVTKPRIYPHNIPNFLYDARGRHHDTCQVYSHITSHHLERVEALAALVSDFTVAKSVDRCERYRLTMLRLYKLKIMKQKKETAKIIVHT